MLKKAFRLSRSQDFKKVLTFGKAAYSSDLTLKYLKNFLKKPRFGIIVSTKVNKSTVARNKLKRRLREILRKMLFSSLPEFDFVIIPKKSAQKKKFLELEEQSQKLFKRVKSNK